MVNRPLWQGLLTHLASSPSRSSRTSSAPSAINRLASNCLLCEARCSGPLPLCPACHRDLPWNPRSCRQCGLPSTQPTCSQCQQAPPPQSQTLAPLRYDFPVDHLVSGLKYHGQLAHAPLLGMLLRQAVESSGTPAPDLLLPVPLHRQRLAGRGYNQALEIARPLARHFGLPLEIRLLHRHKATAAQMALDARARQGNPAGAFTVDRERLQALGHPQRIAVIDDVMTTGATLREIAHTLQQAGIPHVEFWVVARTP